MVASQPFKKYHLESCNSSFHSEPWLISAHVSNQAGICFVRVQVFLLRKTTNLSIFNQHCIHQCSDQIGTENRSHRIGIINKFNSFRPKGSAWAPAWRPIFWPDSRRARRANAVDFRRRPTCRAVPPPGPSRSLRGRRCCSTSAVPGRAAPTRHKKRRKRKTFVDIRYPWLPSCRLLLEKPHVPVVPAPFPIQRACPEACPRSAAGRRTISWAQRDPSGRLPWSVRVPGDIRPRKRGHTLAFRFPTAIFS